MENGKRFLYGAAANKRLFVGVKQEEEQQEEQEENNTVLDVIVNSIQKDIVNSDLQKDLRIALSIASETECKPDKITEVTNNIDVFLASVEEIVERYVDLAKEARIRTEGQSNQRYGQLSIIDNWSVINRSRLNQVWEKVLVRSLQNKDIERIIHTNTRNCEEGLTKLVTNATIKGIHIIANHVFKEASKQCTPSAFFRGIGGELYPRSMRDAFSRN